jgi:uncharacterized membrane-anchored protein
MARDYLFHGFEILTILLGILALLSFFFYTSKGFVTRKTLVISIVCIVLFMMSLWMTVTIGNPSISLPVLVCLAGVLVIAGIDFAIKYFTLPSFQRRINKRLQRNNKDK